MLVYSEVPGIFGNCKIALISISHLPALFSPPTPPTAPPPAPSRPFRPLIRRALAPTRRGRPPPPPSSLALELSRPSHAPRRFQNRPAGRHLAAAVESPNQRPSSRSFARLSTTRSPARYSSPLFASSLTPRPRTPQPLIPNPGELHPAAEPPPQARSTPTAPTISSASS